MRDILPKENIKAGAHVIVVQPFELKNSNLRCPKVGTIGTVVNGPVQEGYNYIWVQFDISERIFDTKWNLFQSETECTTIELGFKREELNLL